MSFHIPIFFIVAGFLAAQRKTNQAGFGETVKKNFIRLIIPYFFTGLLIYVLSMSIEFPLVVREYLRAGYGFILSLKEGINFASPAILKIGKQTLIKLVYGTSKQIELSNYTIESVGYLWFLPASFFANLIFYFFIKLFEKYSAAIQITVIMLLAGAGYIIGMYLFLPWGIQIALVAQIFLYFGYSIRRYRIYEKKTPLWVLAGVFGFWIFDLYMGGINMMQNTYNIPVISITGAAAASYLIIKAAYYLSDSNRLYYKTITYIGKRSLVIYCFHVFDILTCSPVIRALAADFLYSNKFWMLLTVWRLAYSVAIAKIIEHVPVFKSVYYPKTSRQAVS
jgi:fucose 4-O-acetylase-like acetyltransferase